MNNKKLGTSFEREFCELLNKHGFWVHFCTPNASGSQPCDIIAAKVGYAFLIDCKTSVKEVFLIDRLEENQKLAFEKWEKCGNENHYIAVKYKEKVYMIEYQVLLKFGKIKLTEDLLFENIFW